MKIEEKNKNLIKKLIIKIAIRIEKFLSNSFF